MKMSNEFFDFYTFLSDYEVPRDYPKGNFCFVWNRFNEFRAKFFKGTIYPPTKALSPAESLGAGRAFQLLPATPLVSTGHHLGR